MQDTCTSTSSLIQLRKELKLKDTQNRVKNCLDFRFTKFSRWNVTFLIKFAFTHSHFLSLQTLLMRCNFACDYYYYHNVEAIIRWSLVKIHMKYLQSPIPLNFIEKCLNFCAFMNSSQTAWQISSHRKMSNSLLYLWRGKENKITKWNVRCN